MVRYGIEKFDSKTGWVPYSQFSPVRDPYIAELEVDRLKKEREYKDSGIDPNPSRFFHRTLSR